MLLMPSKTTNITWVSLTVSKLQRGGITCWLTKYATCALVPLMVRLLIAHAASFWVWNSPYTMKMALYIFVKIIQNENSKSFVLQTLNMSLITKGLLLAIYIYI